VQSYSGGSVGAQFTFVKGTSHAGRDSLLAALRRMRIVERVEVHPAADAAGQRPGRPTER
jgi:hypothetical protein